MDGTFDDEAEPTISIQEYLKDVDEQELEADLVLGGDEGKECTYSNGYMKRQAVFSCLTCTPDGNSGVCTACSLSCHDGHQIVELWTKRNFKCDCGNSKFGEFYCKLFPNKDIENCENSYNHNFKGSYCTCGRPYPDPDAEEQVEMIQCCLCEDWFHEEHLGLESFDEIPRDDEGEPVYEDIICGACSAVCSFLKLYPEIIMAAERKPHAIVKVSKDKNVVEDIHLASGSGNSDTYCKSPKIEANADPESANGVKGLILGDNCEGNTGQSQCSKRCDQCMKFYNQKHIGFLLDKEDSIVEYEKMAKQKREEKLQQQEGAELSMLNKLGHVEKMEILNGIADMKDEIRSFLESFDSSKAITSADVHQVFENLAKKRRRVP
ncbi:PHD finger protein-related [Quillaja saponaria]|uniref:PHD finger protein-related n=1 Tax=Quillaja saponaria TaxID=32244 RepID=A0AAD7L5X5_QUISA|nr:PHD finger protein-related [Quillaja saponaria]